MRRRVMLCVCLYPCSKLWSRIRLLTNHRMTFFFLFKSMCPLHQFADHSGDLSPSLGVSVMVDLTTADLLIKPLIFHFSCTWFASHSPAVETGHFHFWVNYLFNLDSFVLPGHIMSSRLRYWTGGGGSTFISARLFTSPQQRWGGLLKHFCSHGGATIQRD